MEESQCNVTNLSLLKEMQRNCPNDWWPFNPTVFPGNPVTADLSLTVTGSTRHPLTAPNEQTIGRDWSGDWRSASFSALAISRDRLKIIELGASPPPEDYLQLTTLLTGLDTVKLSNHCGGVSIKGPVCVLTTAIPVPVTKCEGLRFCLLDLFWSITADFDWWTGQTCCHCQWRQWGLWDNVWTWAAVWLQKKLPQSQKSR